MCPGHVPGSRSESVTERSTTRAEANDSSSTLLLSVSGTQRLPKPLFGLGYRVPAYPFEQSLQDGFLGLLRRRPLFVVLPRVDVLFEGLAQQRTGYPYPITATVSPCRCARSASRP